MAGEQGRNLKAKETNVDELVDLARRACAPQITTSQIFIPKEEEIDDQIRLFRQSVSGSRGGGLAWPTTELDSSWRQPLNSIQAEMEDVAEIASPVIHPPSEEAKNIPPIEMTIGNRTYEVLSFFRNHERFGFVSGWVMVNRANEMNANLGEDDGQYILNHQDKIPFAFRNFIFVFTNWRRPDDSEDVYYICWDGDRWVQGWAWLDGSCDGYCRVLRRKLETLEA